jgi:transcriptional regulator with XRE-family HTH domain
VSQQKVLTNFEKANLLRDCRKRMSLSQREMAFKLGLDSTYLSQLENAHRDVDVFYVAKAGEMLAEFEKSNFTKDETATVPTRESCLGYLSEFLDGCTPAQTAWTSVELREHFPFDKWQRAKPAGKFYGISSVSASDAAAAIKAAAALVEQENPSSAHSPSTAGSSGQTAGPSPADAKPTTKMHPVVPKPAPK